MSKKSTSVAIFYNIIHHLKQDDEIQHVLNEIESMRQIFNRCDKTQHVSEERRKRIEEREKLFDVFHGCAEKVLKLKQKNKITSTQAEEKKKLLTCHRTACDHSYFFIQILARSIITIAELNAHLQSCEKRKLAMDDILLEEVYIVYHNKDYYRAEIVSYNDDRYTVNCIDYGYILQDIHINNLYSGTDDDIFQASSIAKKCRLYGISDSNQEKAIEEIIKDIPSNEYISIIVEHEDAEYLFVTLIRENNDNVNDHY